MREKWSNTRAATELSRCFPWPTCCRRRRRLPDAQAEVYRDTPLCRRRMYTAVSRATHRVTALSQGPVTPLLPGPRG